MISFLKKLCCKKEKQKEVYVLKLENNKYYVGESFDKENRIINHKIGRGSSWTRKYKVINEIPTLTKKQSYYWELTETINLMKLYGVDNVRGSLFTKTFNLSYYEKIMAGQLYCELNNLCRKCGKSGHFISNCNNDNISDWVKNFGGHLSFPNDNKRGCINCFNLLDENSPSYQKYCKDCYFQK